MIVHFVHHIILPHIFEREPYFMQDIVGDRFVPNNMKPKLIPKPAAKPAPKPIPKGKHVQLIQIRWGGRLQRASIPQRLMPLAANEDSQNMRDFACAVYHALGKVWGEHLCARFAVVCVARKHGLVETRWALNRCFARFSGTVAVLAQGGGGLHMFNNTCRVF